MLTPECYQIRVRVRLDPQWADWFGGMTIAYDETVLIRPVADQAALFGL